jgi:hypothetical protein
MSTRVTRPHIMDSDIDLENLEIAMPGMAISGFQPDTSSVENPVSQATVTGQDADNGAQPAVPQAGGVTSISPCCCIPETAIRSFRGARGKRHPGH